MSDLPMAEEPGCFPELYSPDLTRYVFTSRRGREGMEHGDRRTQGPEADNCGQEGVEDPTSPPEKVGDCRNSQSEAQTHPYMVENPRHIKKDLIPFKCLTLEALPHDIRTPDNLELILEMCERIALLHLGKPDNVHPSEGSSEQRPHVPSATTAVGFIYTIMNTTVGSKIIVVTSPEILPTNEAVERSVLEVALDKQAFRRVESMPGVPLPPWSRAETGGKFSIALYEFGFNDWIDDLRIPGRIGYHPTLQSVAMLPGKEGQEKIVCVVSWTQAGCKCVSFEQVLQETREHLLHDAPVRPDCLGSFVMVFSSKNYFLLAKGRGDQRGGVAVTVDWNRVKAAALLLQDFIPVVDLTLDLLPDAIRSKENLKIIQEISKLVVRVNVNKLSERRPKNDPFIARGDKTLTGTGTILKDAEGQELNAITIQTNKHIIYDTYEGDHSTIDINYDTSSFTPKRKRTGRRRGTLMSSYEAIDQCTVFYCVKEEDWSIIDLPQFPRNPVTLKYRLPVGKTHEWESGIIFAVVSHPLGEPKHVSFGRLISTPDRRGLRHSAPTLPGSSGAPMIAFTQDPHILAADILFYHEGKDMKHGWNICHSEEHKSPDVRPDDVKRSMDSLQLVQFIPIFAEFLLHPEDYRPSLRESTLGICNAPSGQEISDLIRNSPNAEKRFLEIVQDAPIFFPPGSQRDSDVISSLLPLMTSGMPCRCRSIVRSITRSTNPDAEVFTISDAAPPGFNPCRPWPWSCDISDDLSCIERQCLLRAVLTATEWMEDAWPFLALLVLILKANCIANKMETLHQEGTRTLPTLPQGQGETTHGRGSSVSRDEVQGQQPGDVRGEMTASEKEVRKAVAAEVNTLNEGLSCPGEHLVLLSLLIQATLYINFHVANVAGDAFLIGKEFPAFCHDSVARWRHLRQHVLSTLSQTPFGKRQTPISEATCRYGAPTSFDVIRAFEVMFCRLTRINEESDPTRGQKLNQFQANRSSTLDFSQSFLFMNTFSSKWDTRENFEQGRDILSRAIACLEVYLFNCSALLRRLRQDYGPMYISTPVSVYGRPGGWPGSLTPSAVRATAWRLIREAVSDVGVRPTMLPALEQDADRREKVIDLYVDMKQLKFQGRMKRSLFIPKTVKRLMCVIDLSHFQSMSYADPTLDIIFRFLQLLLGL